ncbi:unnamed protein product, partial [Rotaria magnacalcarata]
LNSHTCSKICLVSFNCYCCVQ